MTASFRSGTAILPNLFIFTAFASWSRLFLGAKSHGPLLDYCIAAA
jgi:hypothetical protein